MYSGGVIDCDVHHDWPNASHLVPYMSEGWQEYVRGPGRLRGDDSIVDIMPSVIYVNPTGLHRPEAYPDAQSAAASDYQLMREQLLDPMNIERALLGFGYGQFIGALPNPYLAAEVCRAANDWNIEHWLDGPGDDRLWGSVLIPTQLPDVAADEIRRVGGHPKMAQVIQCSAGLGKPFGYPAYHPIYEAASEMGLPIAIHIGGENFGGPNVSPTGGGMPVFYYESKLLSVHGLQTHLTSFVTHGVFEKYPDLKLLLIEPGGVAWLPWMFWGMDACYKSLRRELPWLKRFPSEYLREHVRFTTQPLDSSPRNEQLIDVLSTINAEDVLMFSSDYPHWDTDDAGHIAKRLPQSWHAKVFRENAVDFFGWTDLKRTSPTPAGAGAA
jgi:predicted TIM-barrel fold metal-dependent hydrolase